MHKQIEAIEDETEFWSTAFTELVGWLYHPGYNREGTPKPTLDEIADTVDQMVLVRRERLSVLADFHLNNTRRQPKTFKELEDEFKK